MSNKQGCLAIGIGASLIGVIILGFSSYNIVPPGHRGVVVSLGKVNQEVKGEGFGWKTPFIDKVVDIPIQQITIKGVTDCFSSDLQTVGVNYSVMYRLPENKVAELYQQYAGDPYQTLVAPRLEETLKQVTSGLTAEGLATDRSEVKGKVLTLIRAEVKDMVNIVDIAITNITLSKELERAIEEKQVMQQQVKTKEREVEKAQKEAEIVTINAKAEADAIKIRGEALKASPEVVQLNIIERWDGKSPTTVVTDSGGANIVLPLK